MDREQIPMKIWFDTEFIDNPRTRTVDLISIGLIRSDDKTYYAESSDFLEYDADQWVKDNVFPLLHQASYRKPRKQIAEEIKEFVGPSPEFWAYYGAYDWLVLCQLYGKMIDTPEKWPHNYYDLKQLQFHIGIPTLLPQLTPKHHALNDAIWTKAAMNDLLKRYHENTRP